MQRRGMGRPTGTCFSCLFSKLFWGCAALWHEPTLRRTALTRVLLDVGGRRIWEGLVCSMHLYPPTHLPPLTLPCSTPRPFLTSASQATAKVLLAPLVEQLQRELPAAAADGAARLSKVGTDNLFSNF